MNAINVASVVFLSAVGGVLVGLLLRSRLPESQLRSESKDIILLGTGLIATMAALVLGLLVGAAKSTFDEEQNGFQDLALNFVLLDRTLAQFGPETKAARDHLRKTMAVTIDVLWAEEGSEARKLEERSITQHGAMMFVIVRNLKPQTETQRWLHKHALKICGQLSRGRWQLTQQDDTSLPMPFLVVLAFWLFVLFTSFGLFSPRNPTVLTMLMICALSVAGAVFLIVDLDQPFNGVIKISNVAMRDALKQLSQ